MLFYLLLIFDRFKFYFQVDPFEIYNAFFGGSDGLFGGMGEAGGINFNLRSKGKWDLDIQ